MSSTGTWIIALLEFVAVTACSRPVGRICTLQHVDAGERVLWVYNATESLAETIDPASVPICIEYWSDGQIGLFRFSGVDEILGMSGSVRNKRFQGENGDEFDLHNIRIGSRTADPIGGDVRRTSCKGWDPGARRCDHYEEEPQSVDATAWYDCAEIIHDSGYRWLPSRCLAALGV